nr:hypothetical protein [uncultured Allomuricauda sp.]
MGWTEIRSVIKPIYEKEKDENVLPLIVMTAIPLGIVFATAIILVIVPCLYLILEDARLSVQKGRTVEEVDVSETAVS